MENRNQCIHLDCDTLQGAIEMLIAQERQVDVTEDFWDIPKSHKSIMEVASHDRHFRRTASWISTFNNSVQDRYLVQQARKEPTDFRRSKCHPVLKNKYSNPKVSIAIAMVTGLRTIQNT